MSRSDSRDTEALRRRDENAIPRQLTALEATSRAKSSSITLTTAQPIVISIEAAIGTGKSTLLRLLQQRKDNWRFVQEPVDQWQTVGGKHNLLQSFYEDKRRYAFSFQTYCVLSRIESVSKMLASVPPEVQVVVLERSWFSDRNTFGKMLHEQQNISDMEWQLYNEWYQFAVRNSPTIHGHVYLECDTATCMNRLQKRHRCEEVGVTADYQKQLIDKHEEWLSTIDSAKVCKLNVNNDFLDDDANCSTLIDNIDSFVARLRAAL